MTNTRKISLSIAAIVIAAAGALALVYAPTALAEDPAPTDAISTIQGGLNTTAAGTFTTTPVTEIIGNLIGAMLALTGIIFVVIMVYAGMLYMTAAGEEARVKKAKSMISTSVIGIVIVVTSYAITEYVLIILQEAT